jgi:hypothetical protein
MTKSGAERAAADRLVVKYQRIFTAIAKCSVQMRMERAKNEPGISILRNRSEKQIIQRMLNLVP